MGLAIIGINHKSSPVAVRERFWLSEPRRYEALRRLTQSPGILEAVILATCNRVEFIVWGGDSDLAIHSIRQYLMREAGLLESDWKYFYVLQEDEALTHIFRVASSLDSMVVGEPHISGQVKTAWAQAQQADTTGIYLDAVFKKALSVSRRVRNATAIGDAAVSVPYAAVELARQVFGDLSGRKVLILGSGKMGELSARYLVSSGASTVLVTNRTFQHAAELAEKLHGTAVPFEDRWRHFAEADIVISATGCPHVILDREDAVRIHRDRQGRQLLLIDIAVPRDIDPAVQEVPGITLHNIDDLRQTVELNLEGRRSAAQEAEMLVAEEAGAFRHTLAARRVVPTLSALSDRLEEIRRQEMEKYRKESGPLSEGQEQALEELTSRTVRRIASLLGRELRETAEAPEVERMMATVHRLFRLPRVSAGARGEA